MTAVPRVPCIFCHIKTASFSTCAIGSLITKSAVLSAGVTDLFIRTILSPVNSCINPAAGYTPRDVPPIIKTSAFLRFFIEPLRISGSSHSSYKTTSGRTIPPHKSHVGIPSVPIILSSPYFFPHFKQ